MERSSKIHESDFRDVLYLQETESDVEILVKSGSTTWRFPCHKAILCASSETFTKWFSVGTPFDRLDIDGLAPEAVVLVLCYIYQGRLDFNDWRITIDVFHAAYRYSIPSLAKKCSEYLLMSLNLKNVCYILELALSYDLEDLRNECLTLCSSAAFMVLHTPAFYEVKSETVKKIVSRPDLNVENEIDVFIAVWLRATFECCRSQKTLTSDNIIDAFMPFVHCVAFEHITNAQVESLNESAMKNFCETQIRNVENLECKTSNRVWKKRTISFPLNLPEGFYFVFHASPVGSPEASVIKGNRLSCFRFSLSKSAYLISFRLVCHFQEEISPRIRKLQLIGGNEVFKWPSNSLYSDIVFTEVAVRMVSTTDSTQLHEIKYDSTKPLLLELGIIYTLELDPSSVKLEWPEVRPTEEKSTDEKLITVHSKSCWCVSQMTILSA